MLRDPLSFREAVGALHDVVVCDLRYKAAGQDQLIEAYKAEEKRRESRAAHPGHTAGPGRDLESMAELPEPYFADLEKQYKRLCSGILEEAARVFQFLDEA